MINVKLKSVNYGMIEECLQVVITYCGKQGKRQEEKERKYYESTELEEGLCNSNPSVTQQCLLMVEKTVLQ